MNVLLSILAILVILVGISTYFVKRDDSTISDVQFIAVSLTVLAFAFALNHYLVDILAWGNMLFS